MFERKNPKYCLIYPENKKKAVWDFFMTLILFVACITTPIDIAFTQISNEESIKIFNHVLEALFFIDMIVIFNSACYDEDLDIIEDRKVIACNYLSSWFTIDLLGIIPFELILKTTYNYGPMARIARLGKLYKLARLAKLLKAFKIAN